MIAGYSIYAVTRGLFPEESRRTLACAAFSALAADFDFLPGIVLATPGRFHHGASHSLGAVVLYAVGVWLVLNCCRVAQAPRLALLFAGAYLSHLLLDFLAVDTSAPRGIPLFWPVISTYYISPVSVFMDIHRADGGMEAFLLSGFTAHNLVAAAWEIALLTPIALWSKRAGNRAASQPQGSPDVYLRTGS
jgi:membrane-bound metal-dependent hydrolase YbcI (DUF457 family)